MILRIDGHSFHYEMENLCRIFFPYQKIQVVEALNPAEHTMEDDAIIAGTILHKLENGIYLKTELCINGRQTCAEEVVPFSDADKDKELERRMALLLYGLLTQACGYMPKWGILTGVRPIKLLRRLTEEMGEQRALDYFHNSLLVSEQKTQLSHITMRNEQKLLELSRPDSFSLYVSIPFCPTRCSYCSFVSSSVEKTFKLIPEYVRLLCEEVKETARVAKELHLRLETVYIGGGTPTTLSAEQLAVLLDTIAANFDLSTCREFTVEAGRPDTITPEKLKAMKPRGVTRISINPQTLNDEVLRTIGRRHTVAQTLEAFAMAREYSFDDINMDLIVGLPKDSMDSFCSTLDKIISLAPESITVHALALKRSAKIFQDGDNSFCKDAILASEMLEYADRNLLSGGWKPYYLYRQSRMVGNLENTGWALPGKESLYNVYIMDETHTILACGAGAVSKICDPYSDRLERIFNFKYPYEYINRNGEILTRKDQVKNIYEKFGF